MLLEIIIILRVSPTVKPNKSEYTGDWRFCGIWFSINSYTYREYPIIGRPNIGDFQTPARCAHLSSSLMFKCAAWSNIHLSDYKLSADILRPGPGTLPIIEHSLYMQRWANELRCTKHCCVINSSVSLEQFCRTITPELA